MLHRRSSIRGRRRTSQSLPHLTTTAGSETTYLVFDRLTAYDLNMKPQPMLAESWELSNDSQQIKLNLRKGVQYHTGREFTSDDVKYNLLRVRDPKVGGGQYAGQSNWFTTIDLPDKNTVVLKSDAPRLAIFDFFQNFNILDRVTVEGGQHLSPALAVHVAVDHQHRAVPEDAAKDRVRLACVIDGGIAREDFPDLRRVVDVHQLPHNRDVNHEDAAVAAAACRDEAWPVAEHERGLNRRG